MAEPSTSQDPDLEEAAPRPPAWRTWLKRLIQVALTGLLLYLATRKVDWQKVQRVWAEVSFGWVVVAFLMLNAGQWVSGFRQKVMMRFAQVMLPYRFSVWLFYQGMFYNLVLPGGISGDGYKAYVLQRHIKQHPQARSSGNLKRIVLALLLDRGSGALALGWLCCLLLLFTPVNLEGSPLAPWYAAAQWVAGAVVVLLPLAVILPVFKWHWVKAMQRVFPLAVGTQVAQLGFALAMTLALGVSGGTTNYLLVFAASSLIAVLPISIGGIGAREYVMSHAYLLLPVPPEVGLLIGLSYNVLYLISAGLGALAPRPPGKAEPLLAY